MDLRQRRAYERGQGQESDEECLEQKKPILNNTAEKSNDVSFSCREGWVAVWGHLLLIFLIMSLKKRDGVANKEHSE